MDIVILSTLYHHDLPMCMLPKDHLYTVSNIESVLFSSWPMLSPVFIYDSEKSHFPSCRQHVSHSHIFVIWSHITLLNLTTASFVQRKYPLCFIFYVCFFCWAGSFCQIINKLMCVCALCMCALCVCLYTDGREGSEEIICMCMIF